MVCWTAAFTLLVAMHSYFPPQWRDMFLMIRVSPIAPTPEEERRKWQQTEFAVSLVWLINWLIDWLIGRCPIKNMTCRDCLKYVYCLIVDFTSAQNKLWKRHKIIYHFISFTMKRRLMFISVMFTRV